MTPEAMEAIILSLGRTARQRTTTLCDGAAGALPDPFSALEPFAGCVRITKARPRHQNLLFQ